MLLFPYSITVQRKEQISVSADIVNVMTSPE